MGPSFSVVVPDLVDLRIMEGQVEADKSASLKIKKIKLCSAALSSSKCSEIQLALRANALFALMKCLQAMLCVCHAWLYLVKLKRMNWVPTGQHLGVANQIKIH